VTVNKISICSTQTSCYFMEYAMSFMPVSCAVRLELGCFPFYCNADCFQVKHI